MIASLARGRVHYAWLVAGATFLVMLVTAGVRSVPGVLFIPLEQEFGWGRASLSLAVSAGLFLYGLCGPFAAAVMERLGMRRVMASALALLALAVVAATQVRTPWQLQLLWGGAVGLGTGAMAGWMAATVASRWFVARRGLVTGILTASNATGQLVFLTPLAALAVTFGWRASVVVMAAAVALVIPVVALVIRDRPRDVGLRPFGEVDSAPVPAVARPAGNPFAAALSTLAGAVRSPDFRLLAASFFVCGASTNGLIGTHLIPASVEHGIPEVQAAGFLAAIGIFDLVGTTLSGWLTDRYDSRWLLAWYYSLRGLSLLFLPYAYGTGYFGLTLFVVFYGLDWVATVPPTVRLAADLFGRERVGTVFAWVMAAHQVGAAAIAFGAGALRTWLGDYQAAFMLSGLLCLLAAGLVVRIGRGSTAEPEGLLGPWQSAPAPAPASVPAG